MRPVAVVADTTHYLPRDLVAASGIHEVSLYVHWKGRQDREAGLPDFDEYYEYLRSTPELPTTSQPSVGDFLEVYEPLVAEGKDIVSIHIASGMSGTYESARQAKAALEEKTAEEHVTVIDSATACGGLGLMALAAFGTLFICGGIQGYQAFVGDLRGAGLLEWPLRILLVIGGFVVATPGGGIMPLSQWQITLLGFAILAPTVLLALVLVRRHALIPSQLRAP